VAESKRSREREQLVGDGRGHKSHLEDDVAIACVAYCPDHVSTQFNAKQYATSGRVNIRVRPTAGHVKSDRSQFSAPPGTTAVAKASNGHVSNGKHKLAPQSAAPAAGLKISGYMPVSSPAPVPPPPAAAAAATEDTPAKKRRLWFW